MGPGLTVLHLDGAAVFEGTFCTFPTEFTFRCENQPQLIDRIGDQLRGAAALYAADERSEELLILPDQLSAALVFTYSGHGLQAASSSLRSLARALRAAGVSLTKSRDFFLELLASEAGGFTQSPYDEIETVPLHSYVALTSNGMSTRPYPNVTPLVVPEVDYEEQLHLAAEEITANASAAATMSGTLTSHLTAGADSRLVGATLTAAGVADKFVFFCGANAVTREQDIAQKVAGHMGWTMTQH